MPLNPAEKAFFEQLAEEAKSQPLKPLSQMSIEEFRGGAKVFAEYADPAADIPFKNIEIPCQAGHELKARFYKFDSRIHPLLIFFPGCGYILDLFEANHVVLSKIAKVAGCHAILVQFRLAPEHPFPAAYEDALSATKYIFEHAADFYADKNKIIVGGFSSGAGLTASICHALKQSREYKIFHQLLFDGCYDYSFSLNDYAEYDEKDFLCNTASLEYLTNLCIPDVKARRDVHWSPYWEKSFIELPTTTILIPEYSRLRSQGEAYAKKLKAAGNLVNKILLTGQTHNTAICRKILSDGEDPAVVAGHALKEII